MKAEELSSSGKFQEAISEYEQHIETRLKEKRKEWENPYFYELRIADLYLKLQNPDEALKRVKLAEEKKIEKELVLDGIRSVAEYLAQHNDINGAVDLLDSFKAYDPDYIDGLVDKIGKTSTLIESN